MIKTGMKCMWKIRRLNVRRFGTVDVNFWNVEYNEPLYAASMIFSSSKSQNRHIFTWHSRPDSKQFDWNLNCFWFWIKKYIILLENIGGYDFNLVRSDKVLMQRSPRPKIWINHFLELVLPPGLKKFLT